MTDSLAWLLSPTALIVLAVVLFVAGVACFLIAYIGLLPVLWDDWRRSRKGRR